MKSDTTLKDLNYYMSLPYSILLKPDEDGTWFAEVPEHPGCMTYGDSKESALELIEDAKRTWLEGCIELNYPIPEPKVDD